MALPTLRASSSGGACALPKPEISLVSRCLPGCPTIPKEAIWYQPTGAHKVLMFPSLFGLGFMLDSPFSPLGGTGAFGHYGAGGSVGWANPNTGVAFGYVMNKMQLGLAGDPRTHNLLRALDQSLSNL